VAALRAAEEAGLTRIELEVFASNHAAIRLYERHGFVIEGVKRGARVLDGIVDDLVCMARMSPDALRNA
jgi:RimJ/RimL family protein N-acetyltransferase